MACLMLGGAPGRSTIVIPPTILYSWVSMRCAVALMAYCRCASATLRVKRVTRLWQSDAEFVRL